jgi:excisionase family DNA binding protein
VLTLLEIARYLKVSRKTIFRMLRDGRLSGFKVGKQWRFLKPVVDDWVTNKMQVLPEKNLIHVAATARKDIPLSRLIGEERIVPDLRPGSKSDILKQLITPLERLGLIDDPADYLDKLLAREKMISTAVGHGVAFPHLRHPALNPVREHCIVLGICPAGTSFKALDGKKTHLFALLSTPSEIVHLQLLAKASLLFRKPSVMRRLIAAKTRSQVLEIIENVDVTISLND